MRVGGLAALAVFLCSCGLETVPSLSSPVIDIFDQSLNSDTVISFVHNASLYSGSDFRGYKIYYKIYAVSSDLARLQRDRDLLTSPTVTQLASLGYRTFTISSHSDGRSTDVEEILVEGAADGDKVTLDFRDFLSNPGNLNPPRLLVGGNDPLKSYLYRTSSLVNTVNQSFDSLRSATSITEDMSVTADELARGEFEVNVFVAAYGITPALVEVYSSPVAWGVVRTID